MMNHIQIGADHLLVEISIASALSALACGFDSHPRLKERTFRCLIRTRVSAGR